MRESLIVDSQGSRARALRNRLLGELTQLAQPDGDESKWIPVGGDTLVGGEVPKEEVEYNQAKLRAAAYKAYFRNPHAKNIINNLTNFCVGYGANIVFGGEDVPEATKKKVEDFWKKFSKVNKFRRYSKEFTRRCFRDGEQFTRFVFQKNAKQVTRIHFLEPDWISSGDPNITHGIETDDADVGNVVSYRMNRELMRDATGAKDVKLDPKEILHSKIEVDANVKRGRSILEPVLADLADFADFRRIRTILNKARASIVFVEKRRGTKTDAEARTSAERATGARTLGVGDNSIKAPKAGTRIRTDKDTEIEFISPNLGSSEAQADGRMLVLAIAAGVLLPEFVLSADASNNNFASIQQASLPLTKYVEDFQAFLEEEFTDLVERVINTAIKVKELPPEAAQIEISFEFTAFDIKEFLKEAQAIGLLLAQGLISKSTAAARFGYSFADEMERLRSDIDLEMSVKPFNDPDADIGQDPDEMPDDMGMDDMEDMSGDMKNKNKRGMKDDM